MLPRLLEKQISDWTSRGLIDEPTASRLREASAESLRSQKSNSLKIAFIALGSLLILAGLILLIAENWAAIPREAKIALWGALQLGFLFGAQLAIERFSQQRFIAEACWLVAAGWVMAGIALVGQCYHLQSTPAAGFWLWTAILFPALWLVRSEMTRLLFVIALAAALWAETGDDASWLFQGTPNSLPLGFVIPLVAAAAGCALAWSDLGVLRGIASVWTAIGGTVVLLIIGWSDSSDLDLFKLNAVPLAFVVAGFGALILKPRALLSEAWEDMTGRILAACILAPILLAAAANLGETPQMSPAHQLAIGTAWLGQFAIAFLLIRDGARSNSAGWVNVGYLGILAGILTRYFDFFSDMLRGGFGLIITGALILFLLFVLNRTRRRTLARSQTSP